MFDVDIICRTLNISVNTLARETGLGPVCFSGWNKGKHLPDARTMEAVYAYAYGNGLRINLAYEKPFQRLCEKDGFKLLFHGAKKEMKDDPDLFHSKRSNDLGEGFYLGESLMQAAGFVSDYDEALVYSYGLKMKGLKIYEFGLDQKWVLFIAYNRGYLNEYEGSKKLEQLINECKNADVIIAPIADNRMFDIIKEFTRGMITGEACSAALSSLDLGRQYALKSRKAIDALGLLKKHYLCREEKKDYGFQMAELRKKRYEDSAKFLKRNRTGKYIEEILDE